jgi:ferritin-like metal-binding protein YciE
MADLSTADAKLVQYLNEAYGLEKRLETALEAHLSMTTQAAYKKRLKDHLSETKRHARDVKKRVKQLGGEVATVEAPGPSQVTDAAQAVLSGAQKAAALARGPLHALRGTGGEEKQLKNAKTEYASEAEEIATYSGIEALATVLGDKETQRLARAIRREEERMRSFLEKQIPRLTKAVAKAEIPASQRGKSSSRKSSKTAARKPKRAKATARAKATRAKSAAAKKTTRAKSTAAKKATRAKSTAAKKATRAKTVTVKATRAKSTRARKAPARAKAGRRS